MKLRIIFILIAMIVSYVWYPKLPEMIPTHWNMVGEVDSYAPKAMGVGMMLGLMIFLTILFEVIPNLDPKKEQYQKFKLEWEIMKTAIIGFFAYIQIIVLYSSINSSISFVRLMFLGMGSLFVLMGNYMSKIRQNCFVGIKIPWTLNNEDNWNKTHRLGSWCFVLAGLVMLISAVVNWVVPVVIFGAMMVMLVLPIGYSFWLTKRK